MTKYCPIVQFQRNCTKICALYHAADENGITCALAHSTEVPASGTNYAVHPGEYLQEWMDDHLIDAVVLSKRLGYPIDEVMHFLWGKRAVDHPSAVALANCTQIPYDAWFAYYAQYILDRRRNNLPFAVQPMVQYPPATQE